MLAVRLALAVLAGLAMLAFNAALAAVVLVGLDVLRGCERVVSSRANTHACV